jgi:hypothetical protein
MNTADKCFRFDQVVHGYRDGHRQLAGSLALDVEAADVMALASDLLTSRSLRPLESYVTAYPLRSGHKYVFARTWPAPEMSRPGCVWTHSLLIDYVTVAKIDDAAFILSLFQRPTLTTLTEFGAALSVHPAPRVDNVPVISDDDAEQAALKIYDRSRFRRDVTLYSQGPRDEHIALAVWAQLPPRLRRTTVFCTARSATVLPFETDLTIAFRDEAISTASDESSYGWRDRSTFRGARLLAKDLTRRFTTPLRQFLRRYSVDVIEPLSTMSVLAQVFVLLREAQRRDEFKEIASTIGHGFKDARDAQVLKNDLLFGRFFGESIFKDRRASALLGTLDAVADGELSLTFPDQIPEASAAMLADSVDILISLLRLRENPKVSAFVGLCIDAVSGAVTASKLVSLEIDRSDVIIIAATWPEILHDAEFWMKYRVIKRELLTAAPLDGISVSCFLVCFRDELQAEDVSILLNLVPDMTVSGIAALWEADNVPALVSRMLVRQLGTAGLLSPVISRAGYLPRAVWSDAGPYLGHGFETEISAAIWTRIIKRSNVTRLVPSESTLAALLFVSGLSSPPVAARVLTGVTLDVLYTVARNGELTLMEQVTLDRALPGAGSFWSWDYCKRIIRAVFEHYARTDSWDHLLTTALSPQTVQAILIELHNREDGLAVLTGLRESLDSVPDARPIWGKGIKDAIRYKSPFWPFRW